MFRRSLICSKSFPYSVSSVHELQRAIISRLALFRFAAKDIQMSIVLPDVRELLIVLIFAVTAKAQKGQMPGASLAILPLQTSSAQSSSSENPFKRFTEFSATMSGALVGGPGDTKIYRSGSLMRTDMAVGYMVTDLDTQDTFAYYPEQSMCMQGSIPPARTAPFSGLQDAKVEHTSLGTDVVDGHPCTIENLKFTKRDGRTMELKVWNAKDLDGFPVKIERSGMGRPRTVLYKDVQLNTPDPALFKHPAMKCITSPTRTTVQPPAAGEQSNDTKK